MKIHCPTPIPGVPVHEFFQFKYPNELSSAYLFKEELPPNFFEHQAEYVSLEDAEVIVLAHNFRKLDAEAEAYIAQHLDAASAAKKPLFLFSFGDFTDRLVFDSRAYVFRISAYRSTLRAQDILTPTPSGDLGGKGIALREKAPIPTVSFCGQAGYNKLKPIVKYYVKTTAMRIASIADPLLLARVIGVYWRRAAMAACAASPLVKTHFVVRRSFSGAYRTIEVDRETGRKEFLDSIIQSDMVLTPKGDGNYSNRLFETLSLGRIPVLIDTEIVLPLEGEIDYESILVRVPMRQVRRTPQHIRTWYDACTEEEWRARQRRARTIFETRLRADAFYRHFFSSILPSLPADARQHSL